MSQQELLSRLVELFARAGIPFMVTGSIASVYFGEPRSTQDIDIVIDPTARPVSAVPGRRLLRQHRNRTSRFAGSVDVQRHRLQDRLEGRPDRDGLNGTGLIIDHA